MSRFSPLCRLSRALRELAVFAIVFVAAGIVTALIVPMPFRAVSGQTYGGEQGLQLAKVMEHRFWVGVPVLIGCEVAMTLARRTMRRRRQRSRLSSISPHSVAGSRR